MIIRRFRTMCEQTYSHQFAKKFDFLSFNTQLINQTISDERVIAFDPSYIPKAGKATYGRGRYWSSVAGAAKWDLDNCGFAVVDIANNKTFHLKAWQAFFPQNILWISIQIDLSGLILRQFWTTGQKNGLNLIKSANYWAFHPEHCKTSG